MRGTLLAMLVAAGIGLVGTAGVSAAPINGTVIGDAAKSFSKGFCVAMFTTRTYLGAAPYRIPRSVGPFNLRIFTHMTTVAESSSG